ncbi:hypothetical protein ACINWC743_A0210 [Acinetobacter sp. WC-743]|uniref:virulence factor TspB C-terminal domain-related protein n=1 Tax=Acinetobacter sp. WC-743 TaxID=903945 RepID=UPI0002AEC440|nr:virulence factor TspB C-terminal domain-related protein [Acinetobacter sp. WC-743]ELW79454.1 hypothetical protein ACINWC743_A0210 [Acinetobacter sp. WC-743]
MRKFFKKIHVLVLSFVLSISNVILINQANAATVGGWSLSNPVAKGASVAYDGLKNVIINGKNVAKTSTALITPTATQVAKVLARGAGGYALSVAVAQLIGDGIDWVLDPVNNQIKYHTKPDDPSTSSPVLFYSQGYSERYSSLDAAINAHVERWNKNPNGNGVITGIRSTEKVVTQYKVSPIYKNAPTFVTYFYIDTTANPNYDPNEQGEEKTIPLPTVAQKIISNAENGNSDAKVATTAAAADIVAEAEKDDAKARPIVNQLEANAQTKTEEEATGETKPNTTTGGTDLSLTFPVFCGWAPVVCEAAQVVISFPAKVEGWVSDLLGTGQKVEENTKTTAESTQAIEKELTKDDGIPEKDKTDINLPDLPINPEKVNVYWGGSCPAPTTTSISFHGQSREITILRYDFICEWAWVIKASVIALASIGAVFIISGRKT